MSTAADPEYDVCAVQQCHGVPVGTWAVLLALPRGANGEAYMPLCRKHRLPATAPEPVVLCVEEVD